MGTDGERYVQWVDDAQIENMEHIRGWKKEEEYQNKDGGSVMELTNIFDHIATS